MFIIEINNSVCPSMTPYFAQNGANQTQIRRAGGDTSQG
jgi:hypothetical protein